MSVSDPTRLVAEFKKSGEFDRLRRELLSQFKTNDTIGTFMSRVQDIVQQRLEEDERLQYLPPEAVHSELMQDMDRFPLVQRAVADLPALTDPSFSTALRRSLTKILKDGRRGKRPNNKSKDEGGNRDGDINMDESDSDSSASSEDNDDEHEHSSDDEELLGSAIPEGGRGRSKQKLVNGFTSKATMDDSSPSSSPLNRPRAKLH